HQRLGDAENADDGDLLENERQVERREELAPDDDAEDEKSENEDDERDGGREGMQPVLDAAKHTLMLFLEDRDGRIGCRQGFLEIRRPPGATRLEHGLSPPLI